MTIQYVLDTARKRFDSLDAVKYNLVLHWMWEAPSMVTIRADRTLFASVGLSSFAPALPG